MCDTEVLRPEGILISNIKMKTKHIIYISIPIAAGLLIFLIIKLATPRYYESKDYMWYAEIGPKDGDLLIRGEKLDRIKNDINKLIYAINGSDKDPERFRTPEDKEPIGPPKLKLIGIARRDRGRSCRTCTKHLFFELMANIKIVLLFFNQRLKST